MSSTEIIYKRNYHSVLDTESRKLPQPSAQASWIPTFVGMVDSLLELTCIAFDRAYMIC